MCIVIVILLSCIHEFHDVAVLLDLAMSERLSIVLDHHNMILICV